MNRPASLQIQTSPMDILWEMGQEGARILRVYSNELAIRLPDRLEGVPVTEIGAYCFSASEHLPQENCRLTHLTADGREEPVESPSFPSVSGIT